MKGRTDMTPRQKQVYNALTLRPQPASVIALTAGIHTSSPEETAAKFCIQLVKLGYAVKSGERQYPKWRRKTMLDVAINNYE